MKEIDCEEVLTVHLSRAREQAVGVAWPIDASPTPQPRHVSGEMASGAVHLHPEGLERVPRERPPPAAAPSCRACGSRVGRLKLPAGRAARDDS